MRAATSYLLTGGKRDVLLCGLTVAHLRKIIEEGSHEVGLNRFAFPEPIEAGTIRIALRKHAHDIPPRLMKEKNQDVIVLDQDELDQLARGENAFVRLAHDQLFLIYADEDGLTDIHVTR